MPNLGDAFVIDDHVFEDENLGPFEETIEFEIDISFLIYVMGVFSAIWYMIRV